jgi:tetratricopeptide (TPR) repeat protein
VLFARQRYQEATATIYDVLAVGPGWDWATLQSFYADVSTYTKQLRALEEFARANPNDAASRFLLAYHYLCIEDPNAARRMLKSVIALQPKDQLAAHLLGMLEGNSSPNRPTSGPS